MAPTSKKLSRVLGKAEKFLGRKVFTPPAGTDDEKVELFVVVFGRPNGSNQVEVLGTGLLVNPRLVLADPDTVTALAAGATATSVGIAWVQGNAPHTQQRAVRNADARVDTNGDPDPTMWAIELNTASTAPIHTGIPSGASPANAWCMLFPWVSFCQTH